MLGSPPNLIRDWDNDQPSLLECSKSFVFFKILAKNSEFVDISKCKAVLSERKGKLRNFLFNELHIKHCYSVYFPAYQYKDSFGRLSKVNVDDYKRFGTDLLNGLLETVRRSKTFIYISLI